MIRIVGPVILVLFAALSGCKKEPSAMPSQKSNAGNLPMLNRSQLGSVNLASDAFGAVLEYLGQSTDRERDAKTRSLPRQWRAVYTVCCLDGEVNNGGHHQFFWNSEGAWNQETLEDLESIGAKPFVPIFRDALAVYASRDYTSEKRVSGNNWEGFTAGYRDKRLEECDNRFYKEKQTLYDYVADHIRANPHLYCGP